MGELNTGPGAIERIRNEPHARRLALAWLAIATVVAAMVIVPFVLYVQGREIRNGLTFEVGALEIALERASGAMAHRERALRAYLYSRDEELRAEFERTRGTVLRALDEAEAQAARRQDWRRVVIELRRQAFEWDAAASALAYASETESPAPDILIRPGPVYSGFQSTIAALLEDTNAARATLSSQLDGLD